MTALDPTRTPTPWSVPESWDALRRQASRETFGSIRTPRRVLGRESDVVEHSRPRPTRPSRTAMAFVEPQHGWREAIALGLALVLIGWGLLVAGLVTVG